MQTIVYHAPDRPAEWPSGPWDDEPDKVQWPDADTGLPCLAVRQPSLGHWCGYVGVTQGHPLYEVDALDADLDVHGGITFANKCAPDEKERGICHVPDLDEPDDVWWLGFDCAHYMDGSPTSTLGEYHTLEFVQSECARLAQQLKGKL